MSKPGESSTGDLFDGDIELDIQDDTPVVDENGMIVSGTAEGQPEDNDEAKPAAAAAPVEPPAAPVEPPAATVAAAAPVSVDFERVQAMMNRLAILEQREIQRAQNEAQVAHAFDQARIENEIGTVRQSLHQAIEAGDTTKQIELQDQLADARARLAVAKQTPAPSTAPMPQQPVQQNNRDAIVGAKAGAWAQRQGTWFGRDEEATNYARYVDQQLAKKGMDPTRDDYYEKLDTEVRRVFPQLYQAAAPAAPSAPVAPASTRPAAAAPLPSAPTAAAAVQPTAVASKQKITLTRSQLNRMSEFGMNPDNPAHVKRYAQELARANLEE